MSRKTKPPFLDIADLDEDECIEMIGHRAMVHKDVVSFITDSEQGKAERYFSKLKAKFPGIVLLELGVGPVPGTVWVKVGPPAQA